ncbi:MAG: efflux transporter outer membrane subunit [Syntrophobacteraceae bacterium]
MRRPAILIACALILSSCSLAPKYDRTPGEVPQEFRFRESGGEPQGAQESFAGLGWWEIFEDPQLQSLVRTALEHNYDVQLAAARVEESRALVGVSRSLWLPQINGSYSFQNERLTEVGHPPLSSFIDPTDDVNQLSLDLFWEIDLFGRLRSQTDAAKAELFASEWARQAVFSSVVADVAQAYFELRILDYQLEISQRTVKAYENSLALVTLRFERGVVSKQDIYQVQALLHTARSTIRDVERKIAQKENQICILLGINPQPIARGRSVEDLIVRAGVPPGLPSEILERRPDVRQAEELLIASNYMIGAARAEFFPRISLTGLLGTQSVALSDLFTGPAKIWSIGPGVTLPIFQSGRLMSNLKTTEARQRQSLTIYQQTVRQAFREVADGLIAHTKFREFEEEQRALVTSYQNYSRIANIRYKGGIESYLAVLDADRQLFSAELDLATARQNQLLTIVQLYKALGGGWQKAERLAADKDK